MAENELRLVGRYALCGVLGVGGMGTVHVGRLAGPHGFSRTVAIKRMHAHLAGDPEFTRLFLDEARLAARISHANVVSTLDIVQEGKELLVILEYVAGASLASLLRAIGKKGARLPVSVGATIVSQALHGLHAAHEVRDDHGKLLGLIHRDVAPDNLLVGTDGITRVLDFGIAKATELERRTRDGRVRGKLRYMAPEQLRAQPLDRRADVYSAGAVLFEALTGRPLVGGNSDVEQLESLRQLAESEKTPSLAAPAVPPVLDAIVRKALAKRPEDRFESASEMARALEKEVGVTAPTVIAELIAAMVGSEISHRKALIEDALTMTRDLETADLIGHGKALRPVLRPHQGPTQRGIEPNLREHETATDLQAATGALGTNDIEILEPSFRPSVRESQLPAPPASTPPASLTALAPLPRPEPSDAVGPTLLSRQSPDASGQIASLELGELPVAAPSTSAGARDASAHARSALTADHEHAPVRPNVEGPLPLELDRGLAGSPQNLPAVSSALPDPSDGAPTASPQTHSEAPAKQRQRQSATARPDPTREAPTAAGRAGASPAGAWAPTPPRSGLATILVPLLLLLACLGGFLFLRMRRNAADTDPQTTQAELPPGAAREECDLMRRRLRAGAPPTGLSRGGWEIDLWLRGRGGRAIEAKDVDTTLFQGQTTLRTRPFKPAAGPEDGLVLTVAGPPTEAAFDAGRYGELIGAADRAFDSATAQQGALLLRCSHLDSYDAALWFRGPDIENVASTMLLTLGLTTESPMLRPPELRGDQTLFAALHDGVVRARHDDLTIYFQKNGATVDIKARSTRTSFGPENLAQSWKTTRFLAEAFPPAN
jgi:serine/threonine-protein kinase